MYKLYAITIILLLTFFVNGCQKVPTFHADNEVDPLHDLFELTPPEGFWYESVNTNTLYGIQLKWTKPPESVLFDGFILKTYNDSLKTFDRIDTLSSKNTDYYVGSTDTIGLTLKYELHSYIGISDDSIKLSKPLSLQVNQSITSLDIELLNSMYHIVWENNILSKSVTIFLERSINDEAYSVISKFDISASSYFDDYNFSPDDIVHYRMYAKTNHSTSDTVYTSNLGIVLKPPTDVKLLSSTSTEIKLRVLNPPVHEKYSFAFISETGETFLPQMVESEKGEWTTATLDVSSLSGAKRYELHISTMVNGVISEPNQLWIEPIQELNYETHFSINNSLGVIQPYFSKDGERIIFINNYGVGWRPEIWSIKEGIKLQHLPDVDNPNGIYIDAENEYLFVTENDSLYKWDFNGNELNKDPLSVNSVIQDIIVLNEYNNAFIVLKDSIVAYNLSIQSMSSHEGNGKLKLSPDRKHIYIINKDDGYIHKLSVTEFEDILTRLAQILDYNVFITQNYIYSITHEKVVSFTTNIVYTSSFTIANDFYIHSNDAVELFYGTHNQEHLIAVLKRYDQSKRMHFLTHEGIYLGFTDLPMINHLAFDNDPIWVKYSSASNRFVIISKKHFYFFQLNHKWEITN